MTHDRDKNQQYFERVRQVLDPTGRRTAKLCMSPFVFDQQLWQRMEQITTAYTRLLEFVFQRFPVDSRIQEVLAYPTALEQYLSSLTIYPKNLAAARIDIFLTADGLKMVESNTEIPGGNEESYYLEQEWLDIYRPSDLAAVPRMQIVYDTLMEHYRVQAEHLGLEKKEQLNICLTQWQSEIDRIRGEYEILMGFIRQRGHRVDVIDPNRVQVADGLALDPGGQPIDLIYRRFTADELPRFAERSWQMAIDWDRARVAVVNPFCTKRVDSKNIMVLFKDESFDPVFPAELATELAIVREIIPWTKKIRDRLVDQSGEEVDARSFLLANKDSLVIKHANAYSSAAVYIGVDIEPGQWQEIVDRSLEGDHIVQELIDLPETDIEYWEDQQIKSARCIYNVSPYLYDGHFGGLLARASTDKLTSFKSGEIATIMPCFKSIGG
jgi:glutathionylspermidine synthase